jgi:hypothetical protein
LSLVSTPNNIPLKCFIYECQGGEITCIDGLVSKTQFVTGNSDGFIRIYEHGVKACVSKIFVCESGVSFINTDQSKTIIGCSNGVYELNGNELGLRIIELYNASKCIEGGGLLCVGLSDGTAQIYQRGSNA